MGTSTDIADIYTYRRMGSGYIHDGNRDGYVYSFLAEAGTRGGKRKAAMISFSSFLFYRFNDEQFLVNNFLVLVFCKRVLLTGRHYY